MITKSELRAILFVPALLAPSLALAHPDKPDAHIDLDTPNQTAELTEKIESKLSKHKLEIAKSAARLKRDMDKQKASSGGDTIDDIEAVADLLEGVFAKDGLFSDLTAMVTDFAQDIDVKTDKGKTALLFDGATVGQIETHKSRDSEDRISISGLGKNLTMDRETIVKDGKKKTRIVIEMDGDDTIDITLPKVD